MTFLAAVLVAATFTRSLERVSTLEPSMARTLYDSHAVQLVYETPLAVDYKARPYRIVPGACELPSVSKDGCVYRFRMREGRKAGDFVRALDALSDPACPNGWIMKDVASYAAASEREVEVRLRRRVAYFPWLMVMASTALRGADGEGTGPYRLTSWRKNHMMVFTRRKPVPDGFDTVRYLVVDDLSTQWLMFLRGELDFLGDVSRDNWDAVVGADGKLDPSLVARGFRMHSMPTLDVMHVGVNMRDPLLGPNRKLRQALNAAFDFPTWAAFYNNRIVACDGPVPHGVPDRLETPFAYRFNLDRARQLLTEAGYPDGIDPKTGRRLVLTLSIGRPDQASREAGELMAAFYAKVGIKLELEFQTWDAFLKAVNEARVQLFRMGWVGDYPHAQNFLQLFYSPNVSPGVNHANYANPEYDAAYEREDWRRCQEIVREDCPWVFTHFNIAYSLTGPRVGNYVPSDFPHGNEQFYTVGSER